MPIPRLHPEDTALLVIDVQERLVPTLFEPGRLVTNVAVTLEMAGRLGIPYLVTEHYPTGLGRTVPDVTQAMTDPSARVENALSACVDVVTEALDGWGRSSVLLCGVEAHVCVLQTALDLLAAGRQPFLLSDAVSAGQPDQIAPALRRGEAAGAVTTGVMSAMYELLGDAQHPARRACVDLARRIRPSAGV